jgi:bifunctional non-homologous end joining protein LigD
VATRSSRRAGAAKQLAEYRRKRDFRKTAEPAGAEAAGPRDARLRFVIQKHAASHLHFDLRLELDGVMKSWAVPKGPSSDPSVKRLAMQVEDHPIEYNAFEGTIPKGEYGGGTVMLWDRGTYAPDRSKTPDDNKDDEDVVREAYARGDLKITFFGEKIRGSYALVRMKYTREGQSSSKPQWLLIKHRDEFASPDELVSDQDTSVETGLTMEEIATGKSRVWRSNRASSSKRGGQSVQKKPTAKTGAAMKAGANKSRARKRIYADRTLVAAEEKPTSTNRSKGLPSTAALSRIVGQLRQIEDEDSGTGTVEVGKGPTLSVTNLKKTFFPKKKLTKGDLMRYYTTVAPLVLPVMQDRPLVLKRFPNGVGGQAFFQQNAGETPEGVRVETIHTQGGSTNLRIVGGDLYTLLYTVQLGSISVDPWHSRIKSLDFADYSIIDLDPSPRATFSRVIEVARWVKETLDQLGLHAALKTSGSSGLHVYMPLPPKTPNEAATLVAQIIATRVAESHPKIATIERSVKARGATTVYVDYLQNIIGKTVAGAYSARANPDALVSTPLDWDELTDDLDPREFTIETAPARFAETGDIWAAALKKKNSLTALA